MKFHYLLSDSNGCSDIWDCEMLIPIGTEFLHEYGLYKVSSYINDNGDSVNKKSQIDHVICDRIKSNQELKNK